MKFTLSKENTFCVALDARWPATQERLNDIPCARWKACLPEEVTEHRAPHLNRFEQACAQSHVTLWREILRRNLEYAFIMEDDILFANDWREKLEAWCKVEGPDWDLVLLNASEAMSPEDLVALQRPISDRRVHRLAERGSVDAGKLPAEVGSRLDDVVPAERRAQLRLFSLASDPRRKGHDDR